MRRTWIWPPCLKPLTGFCVWFDLRCTCFGRCHVSSILVGIGYHLQRSHWRINGNAKRSLCTPLKEHLFERASSSVRRRERSRSSSSSCG